MNTEIRGRTESWPWRRKFSHCSSRISNPQLSDHDSSALTAELSLLPNISRAPDEACRNVCPFSTSVVCFPFKTKWPGSLKVLLLVNRIVLTKLQTQGKCWTWIFVLTLPLPHIFAAPLFATLSVPANRVFSQAQVIAVLPFFLFLFCVCVCWLRYYLN